MKMKQITKPNLTLVPSKIYRGQEIIEAVLYMCGHNVMISGGFARWCASPVEIPFPFNDIDLFLYSAGEMRYIIDRMYRLQIIHQSTNAITYDFFHANKKHALQLIIPRTFNGIRTYGTEQQVGSNFDFTVCQVFITNHKEARVSSLFVRDETERRLRLHSTYSPLSTIHRIIKYTKLGYRISSKELLKVLNVWDFYPTKNKELLMNKFLLNNLVETDIEDVDDTNIEY